MYRAVKRRRRRESGAPIKTPDGEIYISFWNSDKWFLQTEEEMNSDQFEDMTEEPDMGMTM